MRRLDVFIQTKLIFVILFASIALKRPIVLMRVAMVDEFGLREKCFAAVVAFVSRVFLVIFRVSPQLRLRLEIGLAEPALESSGVGMQQHVLGQAILF